VDEKTLEILRKIEERGLVVLSSYQVEYPRYGMVYEGGETVPDNEWKLIQTLWKAWEEEKTILVSSETHKERNYLNSWGMKKTEHIEIFQWEIEDIEGEWGNPKDGSEIVEFISYEGDGFLLDRVPAHVEVPIPSEWDDWRLVGENIIDRKYDIERYKKHHWESDFLKRESIEMDEHYEEHIGLQTRFVLTDKVKELVANIC